MTLDANAIARERGVATLRDILDVSVMPLRPTIPNALLRVVSVEEFMAKQFRPRDYILDPVLNSQGLLMVAAPRGVGKTHVALHMGGAAASAGTFLKWRAHKPRRVTYVDGEMPAADLQARLKTLPYKCEGRLRVLSMDDQELGTSLNLSRPEDRLRVEGVLGETELLILDNRSTLVNAGKENDSESWTAMQDWLLGLRRKGVSVVLVEHAGRSGDPRGTSKREDILDTIISLTRPEDYCADQGARFEVHLTKARGISGADARPFEAKLEIRDGAALWTIRELHDVESDRVAALTREGLTVREIEEETGISKSKVGRIQTKLREEGKLP
jgi:putative DNA primase/helicase